jgi:hypothetical protein
MQPHATPLADGARLRGGAAELAFLLSAKSRLHNLDTWRPTCAVICPIADFDRRRSARSLIDVGLRPPRHNPATGQPLAEATARVGAIPVNQAAPVGSFDYRYFAVDQGGERAA